MKTIANDWMRSFDQMPWILRGYLLLILVFYVFLSWTLIKRWMKTRKSD